MAKKRKATGAVGSRPVLQFRVHEGDYEKLRALATKHKFTISEEAAHQIQLAFEGEQQRLEFLRLTGTLEGMRELLAAEGFRKIHLDGGRTIWAEPGVDVAQMSVSLDAAAIVEAIGPELAALLARGIEQVKPGRKK